MKIGIRQKILLEALEKGSLAATSEDAQKDTTALSLLVKSICITADKNITIESGTEFLSVKHTIPVNDETGVVIKETGCILVPAKELIDWVKIQGSESSIGITLQKLAIPETINTLDNIQDMDDNDRKKFSITKIGLVKLSSKNTSKTTGKWELDCYDPERFSPTNFGQKAEKCFEMSGGQLTEALNKISFAALKNDGDHALNSVSLQAIDNTLYMCTTDMKRCAIYSVPSKEVSDVKIDGNILVPAVLLEQISKILDKGEKISFSYNPDSEKIFISQPNIKVRVITIGKERISTFPSMNVILKKQYKLLAEMPKNTINELLVNAALVNSSSALFVFRKEDNTFTIKALSEENKYKPSVKQCTLESVAKDAKMVLGVSHLLSAMKVIKSENVHLYLPDNMNSVKVMEKDNDNFSYYSMGIQNAKYQSDME